MTTSPPATVPGCAVAGYACRTCARAMLFAAHLTGMEHVHRALWLNGAVEIAPGMWRCWSCSLETPADRLAADAVQHRLSRPELVGFSVADQWGRR